MRQLRAVSAAEFDDICRDARLPARLAALDHACEARGIAAPGADAPAALPALAPASGPAEAARAARCAAKSSELAALSASLAGAEAGRNEAVTALEGERGRARAALAALAPLLEANAPLHLAAEVQAARFTL